MLEPPATLRRPAIPWFAFAAGAICLTGGLAWGAAPQQPNVLLLCIDDLRCDLGALGVEHAKTPRLDALAAQSRVFARHYVQVPTCGASRYTMLRGQYPTQPAHLGNGAIAATSREWAGESLPGWLRRHGYRTYALGKVSHHPGGRTGRGWAEGPEELPGAWDRCWIPESPWQNAEAMMHGYANGRPRERGKSPPWEAFDGPDEAYPDAWVAAEAIAHLNVLAGSSEPWLFAVGFFKPHLPFAAPKRWYDLHDPEAIPDPLQPLRPAAPSGWHGSGEFRGNYGHQGRDPENDAQYARRLRQGYAASTSYMDAQLGRVLDELARLKLDERTIVVVWSDHGFLLGDHAIWGKHCLYEEAVRSPLMIRTPNLPRPGTTSKAVVETVDIAPTIFDLCGVPAPQAVHGQSLRPWLEDAAVPTAKPARSFWQQQRAVRTDRWRLIAHPSPPGQPPRVELFDMENDPAEKQNVAEDQPETVAQLLKLLDAAPSPAVRPPEAEK